MTRPATPPLSARTLLISLLVPLLAAALAGCVSLPTGSAVIKNTSQPSANGGEDVRLWPAQGPSSGDTPRDIVEGFLQTAASDEPDLDSARQYLAGNARATWDSRKVLVFSTENAPVPSNAAGDEFQLTGVPVGEVDHNGRYTAIPPTQQTYFFHVGGDQKTGYRIDQLPAEFGIALTQEAFRQYYTPYSVYYLDKQAPKSSMIPVPVYERSALADRDTASQLAGVLLGGAPPQYDAVAEVAATPLQLSHVMISQTQVAEVTLKSQTLCTATAHGPCDQLAEELLVTFLSLGSISSVEVFDQALGPQKPIGRAPNVDAVLSKYHITITAQKVNTADLYYLDSPQAKNDPNAGRIFRSSAGKVGMVGPSDRKYGQVAVDPRPKAVPTLALVDANGQNLYLAAANASAAATPVFTGSGIGSLSWDAFGHLWFIATVNGAPALFRVDTTANGQPQLADVSVELPPGGVSIHRVSAAPDGHRVAVVYTDAGGSAAALSVGVELAAGSAGSGFYINLADGSSQPILDGWATLSDVVWNSGQTLAILGAQQSAEAPSISELYTDGSPVFTPPDLNAVTVIPPISTSSIAWTTTGRLLAAYKAADGAQEIAAYSPSNEGWETESLNSGISPSYAG
jgi:hypothetical protein